MLRYKVYVTAEDSAALKQLAAGRSVAKIVRETVLHAVGRVTSGKEFELCDPCCRQAEPRPYVKMELNASEHHLWCRAAHRLECCPQRLAYSALKAALEPSTVAGS